MGRTQETSSMCSLVVFSFVALWNYVQSPVSNLSIDHRNVWSDVEEALERERERDNLEKFVCESCVKNFKASS